MSNRVHEYAQEWQEKHPYVGYVVGGTLIVLDNIGRAQVIKDIWSEGKALWTSIHLAWPSHLLTWIGIGFVIFGLISAVWIKRPMVVPVEASPRVEPPSPLLLGPAQDGRVILSSALNPRYFYEQLRDKTAYQADKTTEMYVGKWMRFSGEVSNVASGPTEELIVTFQSKAGESNVAGIFPAKWTDHLSVIPAGDAVTVLGRVRKIERFWIWLEDCELAN